MQPAQQFAKLIIQINSQGLKRLRGGMGAFTARLAQHTANNLGQFARARNARGFTTRHTRPHNGARAAFTEQPAVSSTARVYPPAPKVPSR